MLVESAISLGLGWLLMACLAALGAAVIANVFGPRFHAWLDRPGISLDQRDGVIGDDAHTGTARPCELRGHQMIPTEYGWHCGNEGCGERWFVDPTDELAVADLALWEIENQWQVSE